MQRQEAEAHAAPASDVIDTAPPAYSPQTGGPEDPNEPAGQSPVPVKELPSDMNATQKPSAVGPGASQQPVAGVTPLDRLTGTQPQWIDCPFCQRRTKTSVNKEGTPMQIVAGVLCCLLCVCLACVPCIAGWFEETTYFCSQCHNKVAMRPENGQLIVYGPGAVVPSKYSAQP